MILSGKVCTVFSSTTSHNLYSTVVPLTARGAHVTLVEAVCLSPASVLVEAAWPSAIPVLVEAVCSSMAPVLDQRRFVPPRIPYWIKMAASIDNVSDFWNTSKVIKLTYATNFL